MILEFQGAPYPSFLLLQMEGWKALWAIQGPFAPQKSYPYTKIAVMAKILKFNITPSILVKLTCFFIDPTVRLMGVMML